MRLKHRIWLFALVALLLSVVGWQGAPTLTRGQADARYLQKASDFPVAGAYNVQRGLQNWYRSLGQASTSADGVNDLGVGILGDGDSIVEGAYNGGVPNGDRPVAGGVASYYRDGWLTLVGRMLQDRFNSVHPATGQIERSYGFVTPVCGSDAWTASSNGRMLWVADSNSGWPGSTAKINPNLAQGSTVGNKALVIATAGNDGRVRLDIDPTDVTNPFYGYSVTDLQVIYNRATNGGNIIVDVYGGGSYGTMVPPGTGTFTSTTSSNGSLVIGNKITVSGLSRGTKYSVQLSTSAVSGNVTAYISGLILWNGLGQGVTVFNASHFGYDIQGATNNSQNQPAATLNTFCLGTKGSNTKLVVLDHILNDVGSSASPTLTLSTFSTQYTVMVQAIMAQPSAPAILIVIPVNSPNANYLANVKPYRDFLYRLADTYPDRIAIFDAWKALDPNYGDAMNNVFVGMRGAMTDKKHMSRPGSQWMANQVYRILASVN